MDHPQDDNWMNEGDEQARLDRARRWTQLINFDRVVHRSPGTHFRTMRLWAQWLEWVHEGQNALAGEPMATIFRKNYAGPRTRTDPTSATTSTG